MTALSRMLTIVTQMPEIKNAKRYQKKMALKLKK